MLAPKLFSQTQFATQTAKPNTMSLAGPSLFELARKTFPLISAAAAQIGQETRKSDFGMLSGLLTCLLVTIDDASTLSEDETKVYESNIESILQTLENAYAWPEKVYKSAGYPSLNRIIEESSIRKSGWIAKQSLPCNGLKRFFLGHENVLRELLAILQNAHIAREPTAEDMGLGAENIIKKNNVPGYTGHINGTLHFAIREHSACGCTHPHLKATKLRLDDTEEYDGPSVPFEFAFSASPAHLRGQNPKTEIWHETMVLVLRKKGDIRKAAQRNNSRPALEDEYQKGDEVEIGDLCQRLKNCIRVCLRFNLALEGNGKLPILRAGKAVATPLRNIKSVQSLSFTEFLRSFRNKMSTTEKFQLAYILAKSFWQYYGSDWMKNPWTHQDIQFLEEQGTGTQLKRTVLSVYSPYLTPNFECSDDYIGEYYSQELLIHRYPGILALAMMLIDIIKGLSNQFQEDRAYDYQKIRSSYTLASIAKKDLDCNPVYKGVIEQCLNRKLFQTENVEFDLEDPKKGLETRQSIIYREIVAPLKYLLSIPKVECEIPTNILGEEVAEHVVTPEPQTIYETTIYPEGPYNATSTLHARATQAPPTQMYNNTYIQTLHSKSQLQITRPGTPRRYVRPGSRDEFEIAIICALPLEYEAVINIFDEFWYDGEPYRKAQRDENTYTNGRIGDHNTVLALLPGMGKGNATSAASDFRSSYRNVQLALLVGICGGVPISNQNQEILLGDVIIGRSIAQYDLGRRYENKFKHKAEANQNLDARNTNIRTFLNTIEVSHNLDRLEHSTSSHLQSIQRKPKCTKYAYPGAAKDILFSTTMHHRHQKSLNCSACLKSIDDPHSFCQSASETSCTELNCDDTQIIPRTRLIEKQKLEQSGHGIDLIQCPAIHIGRIACGDTVMKSAKDRDQIARDHRAIAFEMEAVGVWMKLPCIVVKSVCDYADAHKNKDWQNFAAVTAAAATKALLEQYHATDNANYYY